MCLSNTWSNVSVKGKNRESRRRGNQTCRRAESVRGRCEEPGGKRAFVWEQVRERASELDPGPACSLRSLSPWPAGGAGCVSEERLFRMLFCRYNRFIRPAKNVSDPVTVHFELAITWARTRSRRVSTVPAVKRVHMANTVTAQAHMRTLPPGRASAECVLSSCPARPGALSKGLRPKLKAGPATP
ncbi:Neuronal acetylcholine receptor subunit alpha-6 [Heterocephalus glaber]|uniref:Neuronal acetylcholine receptor subunit alpha-6 n=1 Tax=Heterocephalus glaber TaxID=10181 RepID=G5BT49_HETGA|nr:Neuronal acetylcholine receptor subunit alpha-6 [Heterocephalus glaber]